jgi:hypothetical protein
LTASSAHGFLPLRQVAAHVLEKISPTSPETKAISRRFGCGSTTKRQILRKRQRCPPLMWAFHRLNDSDKIYLRMGVSMQKSVAPHTIQGRINQEFVTPIPENERQTTLDVLRGVAAAQTFFCKSDF